MNRELKELNFNDLLLLDSSINLDSYDLNKYIENDQHLVKGYCLRCEQKGCNTCPTDQNFKLQNISHGASSDDILLSTKQADINFSDWHNDGVLFLMEGPSKGYDIYEEFGFNGYNKHPTQYWYWIHEEQDKYSYPDKFKGREYGLLFNSIVFTFKLRNAYLTNLVKCGLNDLEDNYKGIEHYNWDCLQTCVENFLLKEIEIVKPKIVFCFGSKVEKYLWELYPDDYPFRVVGLPHPAAARRGFKDEFFRHLYSSMILEGLYKADIYKLDEAEKKYREFLTVTKK